MMKVFTIGLALLCGALAQINTSGLDSCAVSSPKSALCTAC
jgi:hypothetical protein